VTGAACCAAGGLGVGLYHGINYGSSLDVSLGPVLAAFFGYSAARRAELVGKLRETRAELAGWRSPTSGCGSRGTCTTCSGTASR
jgi:hypothetical protein